MTAEANMLDARCDVLQIVPLDPEQHPDAAQAYDDLIDAMVAVGEKTDVDDQAELRAELSSA